MIIIYLGGVGAFDFEGICNIGVGPGTAGVLNTGGLTILGVTILG
jgi:hypothetical protein